ncbi:MAG TPA: nucleoside monophosphate kinase [Bacilli bacterium]|nr:nucleoside monophosphate kinase [Bacilli bacterium]
MIKNIVLIAPLAAGKGTQAKFMKERYGLPNISVGELLREVARSGSELGKHIDYLQSKRILVENETTMKVLMDRLNQPDCDNGYVLDGFPRSLEQAKLLEEATAGTNREVECVIMLDVPREMSLKRTIGRVTCKECGEIYNEFYDTFKEKGKCNKCNGELFKRNDDNEESFNAGYNVYLTQTTEAIEYYKNKNILHVVDASISKEYTFSEVAKILGRE